MSVADPNQLILTGENPFIRLSATDGAPNTTNASFWQIILCPAGPGHVLYIKSELTDDRWRIYSDNIAMARWLQSTVQGMLNAECGSDDPGDRRGIYKSGDARDFWTERLVTTEEEIALTWYSIGEPLLIHTQPNAEPGAPLRRMHRADTRRWARACRGTASRRWANRGHGSARDGRSAPARWHSPKAGRRRSDAARRQDGDHHRCRIRHRRGLRAGDVP